MPGPKIRLGIAAALFVSWIGYLLYLKTTLVHPALVLSRPQFLVSSLDVIAQVEGGAGRSFQVTVEEVHWPHTADAQQLPNQRLTVTNLADCDGWEGDGLYILPLVPDGPQYQVVATPPSPGYDPRASRPHIYRLTPQTRQQLDSIRKPQTLPLPPLEEKAEGPPGWRPAHGPNIGRARPRNSKTPASSKATTTGMRSALRILLARPA